MKKAIFDTIKNIMIQKAQIKDGVATLSLKDGTSTVFYCGRQIENLPQKLMETDPCFYQSLQDEIFDEIHPY